MEQLLNNAVQQVPALVIVSIISLAFAKAGNTVVRAFLAQMSEARAEYLTAIERLHDQNMEAMKDLTTEVRELRANIEAAVKKFL